MYMHDVCCQGSASSHLRAGHLVLVGEDVKNFIKEACACQAHSVSIIELIRCGHALGVLQGRN